jgi:hypothetical protein
MAPLSSRAKQRERMTMKKALVCGAGGFIRGHPAKSLKMEGLGPGD